MRATWVARAYPAQNGSHLIHDLSPNGYGYQAAHFATRPPARTLCGAAQGQTRRATAQHRSRPAQALLGHSRGAERGAMPAHIAATRRRPSIGGLTSLTYRLATCT